MKQTMKRLFSVVLLAVLVLTCAACNADKPQTDTSVVSTATTQGQRAWDNATYTADTAFGEGKTTVALEVKVEDVSVTFTLHTDKKLLSEALLEHGLIAGDEGEYGLYVKVVNGITADYDKDGHYWSLCKDGAMLMTGVDATEIKDGEHYEFVYAK